MEQLPSYKLTVPSCESGNLVHAKIVAIMFNRKTMNTEQNDVQTTVIRLDLRLLQVGLFGSMLGNHGERKAIDPKRYWSLTWSTFKAERNDSVCASLVVHNICVLFGGRVL